ncbi:MAG: response regulator transcription factor [Chloroflexi bacterium]|jgi:NarL family two-component system response regulator LiaR|nr:MAG: response regulator transcription factor [Chloroflexota bacterium]
MTIRILIVDDHSVVREGLRMFLGRDPELKIVDEAANGAEAIEKAHYWRPDVVLMDLLIPVIDGITATAIIRRELPQTEVIAFTSVLDSTSVSRVMRAGAIGYLLKDAQASELRNVIKSAATGQMQRSMQVSSYLLYEVRDQKRPGALTERETEILRHVSLGKSNKEIAYVLRIAEDTVKTHVRHILAKLDVQNRTQAVLIAVRRGLIASDANAV